MRAFRAGVPWQSTLHSWTLLDSHDSPRFRTVTRSREKQLVGVGLQMTTPGRADDLRRRRARPRGRVGRGRRAARCRGAAATPGTRRCSTRTGGSIALRRSSAALASGGIRYVHVVAPTRSRTSARRATRRCSASRRARRTTRSACPSLRARDAVRRRRRRRRPARRRPVFPRLEDQWLRSRSTRSTRSTRAACTPSRTSRSRRVTASSSCWSARPAAARRPRCAWSPGSRTSPTGRSRSAIAS